jgi:hypothetical protein
MLLTPPHDFGHWAQLVPELGHPSAASPHAQVGQQISLLVPTRPRDSGNNATKPDEGAARRSASTSMAVVNVDFFLSSIISIQFRLLYTPLVRFFLHYCPLPQSLHIRTHVILDVGAHFLKYFYHLLAQTPHA